MASEITYSGFTNSDVRARAWGVLTCGSAPTVAKVACGFQPTKIVFYHDDVTVFEWFEALGAGYYQTLATGVRSLVATGAPTVFSDSDGEGFSIPVSSAFQSSGDVLIWEAYR